MGRGREEDKGKARRRRELIVSLLPSFVETSSPSTTTLLSPSFYIHIERMHAELSPFRFFVSSLLQDDSLPISVFSFDASAPFTGRPDRRAFLPIAKNALKKIRSTRHPDMYVLRTILSLSSSQNPYERNSQAHLTSIG